MRAIAADIDTASELIPLCRMLFVARPGKKFRRPGLGEVFFFNDSNRDLSDEKAYDAWPLEPITLFEGIPILVMSGYILGGLPATGSSYLECCLAECDWSDLKYAAKTNA